MTTRILRTAFSALLAVAALVACGPSGARIKKARTVVYQADYTVVWNATLEAVKASYPRLKVEDATGGVIVTDWYKVERTADTQATDPGKLGGMDKSGGIFFQAKVQIVGKQPPFKVVVDGEAARYRPDYSMLQPFKHGEDGEPHWVPGRIDALYVAIFDRLEQYAVPEDQVQRVEPSAPVETEVGEPQPVAPDADAGAPAPETAPAPY